MPSAEPSLAAPKPSRRLWLLAPYVLAVLLLAGWSVGWFVVKGRIESGLDRQVQALRTAGWTVALADRRVSGFPFRLHFRYGRTRLAAPSGWALDLPALQAEAYLHAPDHWVLIAPQGLTFVRPKGGSVRVAGEALRASLAGLRAPIWRVVLEGRRVRFAPDPDAQPFALASAGLMQLYLEPSVGAGEGRWLARVENGAAAPNAVLGALAREGPVLFRAEGVMTALSAWTASPQGGARAWAEAGGRLRLDRAELAAGTVKATLVHPAELGLDMAGRLAGVLPIEVRPAVATLGALAGVAVPPEMAARVAEAASGRPRGDSARMNVTLEAGIAAIGPVRIGPAPKLF